MKRPKLVGLTVALALVLLSPTALFSQSPRQAASEGNWQLLFNGQDLDGWRLLNGQHSFEVRDGYIVGITNPAEPNGFLVYDEEFGDFILELEVNVSPLMNNSGIQFRSLSYEAYQNGRVHGYQAEIDTKPQRWSGSVYDEARRGWLVTTEVNPEAKVAFRNGEWNHYRIEAIGTSNRIWVNGVPTSHLVDDLTMRGLIGLQIHANQAQDPDGSREIRFRNIRIQTSNLEASPLDDLFVVNFIPNNISAQEASQGFSLLWDGQTAQGWQGGSGWQMDNGILRTVPGNDAEELVSERLFDAFELLFEFKSNEEGSTICGVEYRVTHSALNDEPSTFCQLSQKKLRSRDRWNSAIIRVRPTDEVEYWLNGNLILEYVRDDLPSSGQIVLKHDLPFSYRSLKIRELD